MSEVIIRLLILNYMCRGRVGRARDIDLETLKEASSLATPNFSSATCRSVTCKLRFNWVFINLSRGISNAIETHLVQQRRIRCLVFLTKKAMAPHSSTLAWKIPWTEEPGRLQSMVSWRVGYDWATYFYFSLSCIGEGNGNPLQFLPGESQGRGSLMSFRLWGRTESDTTEVT